MYPYGPFPIPRILFLLPDQTHLWLTPTPLRNLPAPLFNQVLISFVSFSHPQICLSPSSFFPDPMEIQVAAGCELHSSDIAKGFLRAAYQGSDFLSFQNMSWVPSLKSDSRAQSACDLMNQYEAIRETVHSLTANTCPRFALGLFDAGKVDLQKQGLYVPCL